MQAATAASRISLLQASTNFRAKYPRFTRYLLAMLHDKLEPNQLHHLDMGNHEAKDFRKPQLREIWEIQHDGQVRLKRRARSVNYIFAG